MPNAGTLQLHFLGTCIYMYLHVYTCRYMYVQITLIDCNLSMLSVPPGRHLLAWVDMGKDTDKQDKTRTPCSSLIIAYIEYIGGMFWGHIKLL